MEENIFCDTEEEIEENRELERISKMPISSWKWFILYKLSKIFNIKIGLEYPFHYRMKGKFYDYIDEELINKKSI